MTINDKALLRLMKSSYKGGGVKVYHTIENALFLNGGFWAAALPWKYVPGPVLGLVAEWLHRLPDVGEGFWCLHGNEECFDELDAGSCGLFNLKNVTGNLGDVKLLDIHMGGGMAAQLKGGAIYWLPDDAIDLLAGPKAGDLIRDNSGTVWGRWYESDRGGVIWITTIDRVSAELTGKLAEYDFWKGATHE